MGWMGGGASTPEVSSQEKALARDAAEKFNDQQTRFVPLENSFISELQTSAGDRSQLRGQMTADAAQATKGSDQAIVRASGGQAGQGKSVLARAGVSTATGAARGEGVAGADSVLRSKEINGLTKMSAFGRGLQDTNSTSIQDAAQRSSSETISKLSTKIAGQGNTASAVGTFAGTAVGNIGAMESLKDQVKKRFGR